MALVVIAWLTGEEESAAVIRRIAGEVVAGLLVFRLLWGFVGGEHARFADFAAGPSAIIARVRALFGDPPPRHLGHNPLGGVAVFPLLLNLAVIVTTGLFSGGEDNAGPFAGAWGLAPSEVHEIAFRFLQALIAIHIVGVAAETFRSRDALVPAMITGRRSRRADEPGRDARRAGSVALLVSAGFGLIVFGVLMDQPPADPAEIQTDRTCDNE